MNTKSNPPKTKPAPLSENATKEELWDRMCETGIALAEARAGAISGESYLQGYKAAVELIRDMERDGKLINHACLLEGFTDAVAQFKRTSNAF